MVTIHVPGWGLGLEGLSTEGADVQVGVWPEQQQAGQDAHQRRNDTGILPPASWPCVRRPPLLLF